MSVVQISVGDNAGDSNARASVWRQQVLGEVCAVLGKAIDEIRPEEGEDLAEIERRVQRLLRLAGAVLVSRAAVMPARGQPRPTCCGSLMQVSARRARHPQGLFGVYDLPRTEYVCGHCHRRAIPAESLWGLGPGLFSPELSRVLTKAGAEIASFTRGADLVGEVLGCTLDGSSAARTSEAVGAVAVSAEREAMSALTPVLQHTQVPDRPDLPPMSLLLGVDATKAHAGGRWRDVKVAVVATLGPEERTDEKTGRATLVVGPHTYCAAIQDAEAFFPRLLALLRQARWEPGQALRLVLAGDGGPWIWGYVPRLRGLGIEVQEILDLYHAREHVWTVAHAVFGEGTLPSQFWGETVAAQLAADGGAALLDNLRLLQPRGSRAKDEVRKAIDYFTANASRTQYPTYLAAGLPLGSGIVESSCRLVAGLRVKQPGMRWSLAGVQSILALRALHLSHTSRWADFWRRKPLLRRPPVDSLTRSLPA